MHQAMKKGGAVKVPEVQSLNVSFKCDLNQLSFPGFNYVFTLYSKYDKHGTLPFEGPLTDQPAKIIEIFDVISAVQAEEEERQLNK